MGVEQSRRPAPFNAAALLNFHDAIELFLQVASEFRGAGGKEIKFLQYWDTLNAKLKPEELLHKEPMRRLNQARIALKHGGTLPSTLDIEAFRGSATNFFEDNTRVVFGMSFSDISLVDYVDPSDVRDRLRAAQAALDGGALDDAADACAIALHRLFEEYEERKQPWYGDSPFQFGLSRHFRTRLDESHGLGRDLERSIEELTSGVRILALGVDYRRYARFRFLTPSVSKTHGGTYHFSRGIHGRTPLTPQDLEFCISFVLETALAFRDFDYSVETDRPSNAGILARIDTAGGDPRPRDRS